MPGERSQDADDIMRTPKRACVALVLAGVLVPATSAARDKAAPRLTLSAHHCESFKQFSRLVSRMYSGARSVTSAQTDVLRRVEECVAAATRTRERAQVRAERQRWLSRRRAAAFVRRYEPYAGTVGGDGWPVYYGHFALPPCIVTAESHGYLHEHSDPEGSSGLYQIEESNWTSPEYDGTRWTEYPYQATLAEQSIVATAILKSQGIHAWSTAAGCGL